MKEDVVTKPSRNFLDLSDFSGATLRTILEAGKAMKARRRTKAAVADRVLEGKNVVLIFEQPSLRTRMSFEVGIRDLGGSPIMVTGKEIELGEREALKDTAHVMSRYADAIMIRMLDHAKLAEFAQWAEVPVINGLTKSSHPCQVMADVMTFEERLGSIKDRTVAWTGDANNVLASWIHAAARFGFKMRIATPKELAPKPELIAWAKTEGASIELTQDAFAAVDGADAVVTDTWVSMGDAEKERRHNLLQPYQVNARLLKAAQRDAIFLHCLPAHRGDEVTDEVIDSPQSAVLDEAENRLHAQKGVLAWCFDRLPA
ncbi:ornithine carbamoyltransferase [Terrihabitans soli]|uniref:Ornithine carbamoyltransferase n=1 Tax=Terrihabitans soli TaxID=708113 RepID=A0A6S6QQV7_9HYPH|nr:ornithine carbamoyltransferase [Terrihabitans soli]BCJ91956.1 ornithine carbamoyltransferase [Terrihabitans soli]